MGFTASTTGCVYYITEDCYITNPVLEAFVKVAIASDSLEELCVKIANAEVLAS